MTYVIRKRSVEDIHTVVLKSNSDNNKSTRYAKIMLYT